MTEDNVVVKAPVDPFVSTFKVDDKFYDVPDTDVSDFVANMPKAEKVYSFKSGEKTYHVPEKETSDFMANMPDAAPLQSYDFSKLYKSTPDTTGKDQSVGITAPAVNQPVPASEPQAPVNNLENFWTAAKSSTKAFGADIAYLFTDLISQHAQATTFHAGEQGPSNPTAEQWRKDTEKDITQYKKDLPQAKPGWSATAGGIVPFVGSAIASTFIPALAPMTAAAFGAAFAGEGLETYDSHVEEKKLESDPVTRAGAAMLYGAIGAVPYGSYVGGLIPKGLKYLVENTLKSNPQIVAQSGRAIFEAFAKENPTLAKAIIQKTVSHLPGGIGTMIGIEEGKLLVNDKVIGKDVAFKDYLGALGSATGSGILFTLATAPFGAYAQTRANTSRRSKQGLVALNVNDKGQPFEIIETPDGNKGLTPDGKLIDVTEDQIKTSFTIPTQQFDSAIKTYQETSKVPDALEKDAALGRVSNYINTLTQPDGNIYATKTNDGKEWFGNGKDQDGNTILVDLQGNQTVTNQVPTWTVVNPQELFSRFENSQPAGKIEGALGSLVPQQPAIPVDPRSQAEMTARDFHKTMASEDTGNIKLVGQATPEGDETIHWFVKSEQQDDLGNHTYLVQDEQGNQKFMTQQQITGDPQEITEDAYAELKLGEYDQNAQAQQDLEKRKVNFDGVEYILTGNQTKDGDYEAIEPQTGAGVAIPKAAVDKIQSTGVQSNIVTRVFGKTEVAGTMDEAGNIALSDPMTFDQLEQFKEDVQNTTGGKAEVVSRPIPGTDSTLPDQYEVVIQPQTGTQGQAVAKTDPSLDVPVEKKVITQTFGNTAVDIIENEGFDEVVPSAKVTLEKALPALEKKFKDHPKFKLEVEKAQVEIPGETKYDDPTFQTVIKSIKIVPKTANIPVVEPANVPENVNIPKTDAQKVPEIIPESITEQPIAEVPAAESLPELQQVQKNTKESLPEGETLYHGTKNDFAEFDESKMGSTDGGWYGKGFYFHSDPNRGGYGDIVKSAQVDLKNPIILPVNYAGSELYDIVGGIAGLDKSFRNQSPMNIIREIGSDKFTEIAKSLGYDGVVVNNAEGTKEVVAFTKDTIKNFTTISQKPNEEPVTQQIPAPGVHEGAAREGQPQEVQGQGEKGLEENVVDTAIAAQQPNTNPTEAQKEAGNYKKAHVKVQGMDISVENPLGSVRKGTDKSGKAWERVMQSHYGYFKGTKGKDGDHIDTFIGPNPEGQKIFVIDQVDPETGKFDESKVMLGYNTPEEAKAAYDANYDTNWKGFSAITEVGVDDFKKWLYDGAKQHKPFGEYKETPAPVILPPASNNEQAIAELNKKRKEELSNNFDRFERQIDAVATDKSLDGRNISLTHGLGEARVWDALKEAGWWIPDNISNVDFNKVRENLVSAGDAYVLGKFDQAHNWIEQRIQGNRNKEAELENLRQAEIDRINAKYDAELATLNPPAGEQPVSDTSLPKGGESVSLNSILDEFGKDSQRIVKDYISMMGEENIDLGRTVDNARKIQSLDGDKTGKSEAIAEAVQYEYGYPDNWSDLRNAVIKGGIEINRPAIERMLAVGIELPKEITDKLVVPEIKKHTKPTVLSEKRFIDSQIQALAEKRGITPEEWENTNEDEYLHEWNKVSDAYPAYIQSLKDSGELQKAFDNGSIGEKINIRKNIQVAGLDVDAMLSTTEEKANAKEVRNAVKKQKSAELMKVLGIENANDKSVPLLDVIQKSKEVVETKKRAVENTKKEVTTELKKEQKDNSAEVFKEQKAQLLGDLTKIEDILLGSKVEETRKMEVELKANGWKQDQIDTQVSAMYESIEDLQPEQVAELEKLGVKVVIRNFNDYYTKNNTPVKIFEIDVYRDGTVNVGDARTAIRLIDKGFPARQKTYGTVNFNNNPKVAEVAKTLTDMADADRRVKIAEANLAESQKSGLPGMIKTMKDQLEQAKAVKSYAENIDFAQRNELRKMHGDAGFVKFVEKRNTKYWLGKYNLNYKQAYDLYKKYNIDPNNESTTYLEPFMLADKLSKSGKTIEEEIQSLQNKRDQNDRYFREVKKYTKSNKGMQERRNDTWSIENEDKAISHLKDIKNDVKNILKSTPLTEVLAEGKKKVEEKPVEQPQSNAIEPGTRVSLTQLGMTKEGIVQENKPGDDPRLITIKTDDGKAFSGWAKNAKVISEPVKEAELVSDEQTIEITSEKKEIPLMDLLNQPKKVAIEDFGEKIGGAKKDLIRKYFDKINLNGLTLSTIFPKPDIKLLLESGISVKDVAAIKIAHEFAVLEKKHSKNIEKVKFMAAYAKSVLAESINLEFVNNNYAFTDYGKSQVTLRAEAYAKVAQELGNEYLNLDLSKFHIRELDEATIRHYVKKPEGKFEVQYYVDPRKFFDTLDEALTHFAELVKKNTTTDTVERKHKINVYRTRDYKSTFLGFPRKGKEAIRLKENFASAKEAFAYLKENEADLHTMLERILAESKEQRTATTRLKYQNETARDRVGNDWRKRKDATPKSFAENFGFRAVEFGEWATQKERQVFLNNTYDSIMDLAELLNVPPKALSLNGELAVSFGARGSGGASAHFEPEKRVVALTKTKGLGSLAHEVFHAIDNYFTDFKYDSHGMKGATTGTFKPETREEIKKAFGELAEALRTSDLKKRSQSLDNSKSKLYFSLTHEMAARSFENYILNKLAESGQINDFLVNYVSNDDWLGAVNQYPFPVGEESNAITDAFDKIFDAIQTKEEGDNVVMFSINGEKEPIVKTDYQKFITKAKRYFGTTNDFKEAGYLLQDGTMLDFSGRRQGNTYPRGRSLDHREIGSADEYSDVDMISFMGDGNIRMKGESDGFEVTKEPTNEQVKTLRAYIQSSQQSKDFQGMLVDYSTPGDYRTLFSTEYGKSVPASRILNDVLNYYRTGIKPIVSNGMRFSIIGERGASHIEGLVDNLTTAKEMTEAGKDAKTIFLATGWEKFPDGWKYDREDNLTARPYVDIFKFSEAVKARKEIDRLNKEKDYSTERSRLIETLQDFYNSIGQSFVTPDQGIHTAIAEALRNSDQSLLPKPTIEAKIKYLNQSVFGRAKLFDVINDNELFKMFPELKNVTVSFQDTQGNRGTYNHKTKGIELSRELKGSENEVRSTLAHEIQHAIQDIEGFAKGGNYNVVKQKRGELYDKVTEYNTQLSKASADKDMALYDELLNKRSGVVKELQKFPYDSRDIHTGYKRLAGEVESRNVQSRLNLTPEQRKEQMLSETQDVAEDQKIYLQGAIERAYSVEDPEGVQAAIDHLQSTDKNPHEVHYKSKDEIISHLESDPGYTKETVENVRQTDFNAINIDNVIFINSDAVKTKQDAVQYWIHERAHAEINERSPDENERDQIFNDLYDGLEEVEVRRVVPSNYWKENHSTQGQEYITHLAQTLSNTTTFDPKVDSDVQNYIHELVNQFTDLKNIQDAKNTGTLLPEGSNGQRNENDRTGNGREVQPGDSPDGREGNQSNASLRPSQKSVPLTDLLKQSKHKQSQLDIILGSNPMSDDIHTGIRSIKDVKTAEEVFSESLRDNEGATPDFTVSDMKAALDTKSATGNSGAFSPESNDIRYAKSQPLLDYLANAKLKPKRDKFPDRKAYREALDAWKEAKKSILDGDSNEVRKIYDSIENNWFGNVDESRAISDIQTSNWQDKLKDSVKGTGQDWKEIDQAIKIYIDLKRGPGAVARTSGKLSETQQKLVKMSQALSPEQIAVADEITKVSAELGKKAFDSGVIKDVLENHVNRDWDLSSGKGKEFAKGFKTSTGHSQQRVLATILDGWAEGLEMKTSGATNSLQNLRDEINAVIENKKLISTGLEVKSQNGVPLFVSYAMAGYKAIDHPNFRRWMPVKDVNATKEYKGDNFSVTKDGKVLVKEQIYAPDKIADRLNNILGESVLNKIPGIKGLTKFNAVIKSTILSYSFFHHQAFTRSYLLAGAIGNAKDSNPIAAYKSGLELYRAMTPEVRLLIRNGLTTGRIQDWEEKLVDQRNFVDDIMAKTKTTDYVRGKIRGLHEAHTNFLFKSYGEGLKVKTAVLEYQHQLKKFPNEDPNQIAKRVAELVNDDFGGLHLKRMGRNPSIQHVLRLLLLAPDWTESNVRTLTRAFTWNYSEDQAPPKEQKERENKIYRKFWMRALIRTAVASTLWNLAMAFFNDPDDDEKYWETVQRMYTEMIDPIMHFDFEDKSFLEGVKAIRDLSKQSHFLDADITPIKRLVNSELPENERGYYVTAGHFKDPIKWFIDPITSLKHKSSVILKIALEAIMGEDWKGNRFTSVDELLGLDDKGMYSTTSKTKGYKVGESKSGKLTGKLTKYATMGDAGSVQYDEIPSFLLSQIRGMVPIPIQNTAMYLQGEVDGFAMATRGVGFNTAKATIKGYDYKAKAKEILQNADIYLRVRKDADKSNDQRLLDKINNTDWLQASKQIHSYYVPRINKLKSNLQLATDKNDEQKIAEFTDEIENTEKEMVEKFKDIKFPSKYR